MGGYSPVTDKTRRSMLDEIGLRSIGELLGDIPDALKLPELKLPPGMGELEMRRHVEALAGRNKVYPAVFRGMGAYRHFIPSIVKEIASRATFLTAYTPYQAELSQGILQAIFEWQSDICFLTDMDASNASVYDGATAAAEAAVMCQERNRKRVLIAETLFDGHAGRYGWRKRRRFGHG